MGQRSRSERGDGVWTRFHDRAGANERTGMDWEAKELGKGGRCVLRVDRTDDGERARERDDAKHTGGLGGLETVARENNKCLCHIVVV